MHVQKANPLVPGGQPSVLFWIREPESSGHISSQAMPRSSLVLSQHLNCGVVLMGAVVVVVDIVVVSIGVVVVGLGVVVGVGIGVVV